MLLEGPGAGVDLYLDHASLRAVLGVDPNLLPDSNFENGLDGWYPENCSAEVATDWFCTGGHSLKGVQTSGYPNLYRNIFTACTSSVWHALVWVGAGGGTYYVDDVQLIEIE